VVYEVFKIIRIQGEQNGLEAYSQIARTKVVELTSEITLEAAEIRLSTKLGIADSLIATTAKSLRCADINK